METSYSNSCDFNFAVLGSERFIFGKKSDRLIQVKTIKSALWDLRNGDRVRLLEVTVYGRLFTVPFFFVSSCRYTASYRHRYLDFQMHLGRGRRGL